MPPCSSTTSAARQGGDTTITAVHPDIIQTHILSRLDGPSLASASSSSPFLHALCTQEKLWAQLCTSTWASVGDPRVRHVISAFPSGHRSFFSDSFPALHHHHLPNHRRNWSRTERALAHFNLKNINRGSTPDPHHQPPTTELISAVDIKYKEKFLFSKVTVTETVTDTFALTPLWLDLLDEKESVPTPLKLDGDEESIFLTQVEEHVTLSWILIDPCRKRSANVSSLRPVSVRRHWMTGEVQLRYATIVARGNGEHVQVRIGVTCVGAEEEELQIREVSLQVEDMDGKFLSGRDSLVILQEGMEFGERKRREKGGDKERYEKYLELKRQRRVRKMRREEMMDL
ncbi:hypothetical protein LguiB_001221 [Lonicera macranthoides]